MADGGEDFRYADEESSGEEESHKDRRGIKDEISTSGGEGIHYADKGSSGEEESHKDRRGIKDEISTSGEEIIPYVDADEGSSGEEESHKDRRGIKDEISTSGDQGSFNIGKAWETLKFQIYIKKSLCEYEATKQVDMCKLQFVLESKYERIDFLRRFTEDMEFDVVSAGVVQVSGDFDEKKKIEAVWSTLIMSVNDALDHKVVECHHFQSRQELENILQELDARIKRRVEKGIVGIFTSYEDTTCITKFVGAHKDIETLNQGLYHAMANKKQSCTGKSDEFDKSINISFDEDIYFVTMKLNEQFLEKFPHVKLEKEENNSRAYKFTCPDKNDLGEAINWFKGCMNKMGRFELDFSSKRCKFINQNENVQVYLQRCLRKVPADLRILSDRIYILCCKSNLQSSEQIVADSIKSVELEGSLSPEAEKIQNDSHGKIQVFKGYKPGMIIIWYTADKSSQAKELENLVTKYKKYKKKQYSDKHIKAMKALGVIKELQEEYKDILIRTGDADVILQGPEMDGVDACFEKLDTVLQQIKFVELNTLPELQQKLLRNGKVQTYVTEKLKGKIAFCEVGKTVTGFFIRENENSKSNIYLEIKSCFVEMKIDTRCLEHGKGKSFLSEHPEEVVIDDEGNKISCIICCTADLSQEMEQLLYSYSKSCTGIVANCLQLFGDEYCKELEKQNNIGIEVENDRICVKGPYSRAKSVITEIESHVNTTVLHFGKLDYQRNMLFATDKNKIDSIARSCKCCWKADVFRYEPTELEEKGIDYLCTWNLPRSKEQISIAKIDYNTVKLDVLIIPVNQCLLGEDINGKGIRMYDVHSTQSTQKLGYSEELVLTEKYPCNKYVALVTSEVGQFEKIQTTQLIKSKDIQKSCANIFGKMFRNGLFRVGFALPTSDTNLVGKLEAIIDGFQDITQFYDNMPDSELIFVVKTEAERWMQKVDYISTLKFAPYVRRYISPRYKGLFSSPSLRVQIQKKSILETGAHCIVVAISRDLDLSRGIVSKLVSEACGEQLQEELHSKDKEYLDPWELVMCQSYNMSKNGIQKVIFGFIPEWKHCQKIGNLESFIEDCLLLADSAGCSTVAFPALGTGNLGYPYRDVAVALFNGVDKYVAEGIIGGISTVYISVPQIIKKDVEICQILEREQERRKSAETTSGKQHQAEGFSASAQISLDSKTASYHSPKTTQCLNITLVGCKHSDIERAKKEITQYNEGIEYNDTDPDKILDLVSAELNPGIAKHLVHRGPNDFKKLRKELSKFFNVYFWINKDIPKIEIWGSFDSILQTEQYFENEFPMSPSKSEIALLEIDDQHYEQPKWVTLTIPASAEEIACIKKFLNNEVESLKSNKDLRNLNMFEDRLTVMCAPSFQSEAKSKMQEMIDEVKKLPSQNVNLGSKEEEDFVLKMDFQDSILCLPVSNEKHHSIKVIGKDKVLVKGACQKIKLNSEQGKCRQMDVSFEFEKATFKFKKLEMTVLCHDITDIVVDCIVSPVNEVVSTDTGVAKSIAKKAGKYYKGQCKAIGDKRTLYITECVETESGLLQKCKYVIHVYSPLRCEANRLTEQLLDIEYSVTNSLKKADQLRMTSIAIPFLCTGTSHFPIDHCAIQYYRAVDTFKGAENLKKVFLVDINQDKVTKVCSEISKCLSISTNILLDAIMAVMTSKSHVRYHFVQKQIQEVDTNAVVMKVDKNLNGHGEDMQVILDCATQRFQDVYTEQSSLPHSCTTVVPIQADLEGLRWKFVFLAVIPVLKDDPVNYEHYLNITVQHILQYASERDISDITLPILSCEDDRTSLDLCCKAMVRSVLRFGHQTNRKLKRIQFLSRDSKALTTLMIAMLEQLKNGKIKVAY